jgi:hypothetical protein
MAVTLDDSQGCSCVVLVLLLPGLSTILWLDQGALVAGAAIPLTVLASWALTIAREALPRVSRSSSVLASDAMTMGASASQFHTKP